MARRRLRLAASILAVLGTTAVACVNSPAVNAVIFVDGQSVSMHYAAGSTPRPLVLVLHGINGSGAAMEKSTGLDVTADQRGFVVAYPDAHVTPSTPLPEPTPTATPEPTPSPTAQTVGTSAEPALTTARARLASGPVDGIRSNATTGEQRSWNAGFCCGGSTTDDVTYLRDVVTSVSRRVPIDLHRVYVIGLSNGGMMALWAICQAPTTFAAAGSIAGPYLGTSCNRPVWLHLHGGDDSIVPFHGGVPPGLPAFGVAPNWCLCSFPDSATEPQRFSVTNVRVQFVANGMHTWPEVGDGAWSVDANSTLWSFVDRYHL